MHVPAINSIESQASSVSGAHWFARGGRSTFAAQEPR